MFSLKLSLEKLMVMLVAFTFALTSIYALVVQAGPLTREEAIEISRNTPIVLQALRDSALCRSKMVILADYWNTSYIKSVKEKWPGDVYEKLPNGHGAWRVQWEIEAGGYNILHFVDELTGQVLYEMWLVP